VTGLSVLQAARNGPRELALVQGDGRVSFGELAERVRSRMTELVGSIDDEQLVALRTEGDAAAIEALLACFELGLAVLLLHSRLTENEREQLLSRSPVRSVIDASSARLRIERREPWPDALAARLLAREPQLAAIATSGTTGPARLALLSRRAFVASAEASARRLGWHAGDRWLLALPLAHIGGLSVVTRCLIARRPIVLQSPATGQSSARRLASAIRQGAPSLLSLVPTQLAGLLELGAEFELPAHVRVILTGGAATSVRLIELCSERGWPVVTSYGLTEACSQVATQHPASAGRRDAGVGPPLEGIRVELHQDVIHVFGPTLMSGYIGPGGEACEPETGFVTRDLGRIDAGGCLHVLGRIDDAIITGGENVSPREVETLLERCPGVLEACVFGVPDLHWGEVVAAGLRVQQADLCAGQRIVERARHECELGLAIFKRPRLYACVPEFARGHSGKLDRRATAALLERALRAVK
jgi:o-succinylbenzoate---CoA ligase